MTDRYRPARGAAPEKRRDLLILAGVGVLGLGAISAVTLAAAGLMYGDWGRHLCQADCGWFTSIVEAGYDRGPRLKDAGQANYAFFPAFPALASIPHWLFGFDPRDAAVLTSILLHLGAAWAFYGYLIERLDRQSALFGALLLLVSPYAIYGVSGYSEPLYFLLTTLGYRAAFERRWLLAGLMGALLSAARSNGVLFAAILAVAGWRSRTRLRAEPKELAAFLLALALVPAGLLAFMIHLGDRTGDALAFAHVQAAWDRRFGNPLANLRHGFSNLEWNLYFASLAVAGIALSAYLAARRFYEESLGLFLNILLPLSTGLHSIPRFVFWQMPFVFGIVLLVGTRPTRQRTVLVISALLSILVAFAWGSSMGFLV